MIGTPNSPAVHDSVCFVKDLHSSNGTRLLSLTHDGATLVPAAPLKLDPDKEYQLVHGNDLLFGTVRCRFLLRSQLSDGLENDQGAIAASSSDGDGHNSANSKRNDNSCGSSIVNCTRLSHSPHSDTERDNTELNSETQCYNLTSGDDHDGSISGMVVVPDTPIALQRGRYDRPSTIDPNGPRYVPDSLEETLCHPLDDEMSGIDGDMSPVSGSASAVSLSNVPMVPNTPDQQQQQQQQQRRRRRLPNHKTPAKLSPSTMTGVSSLLSSFATPPKRLKLKTEGMFASVTPKRRQNQRSSSPATASDLTALSPDQEMPFAFDDVEIGAEGDTTQLDDNCTLGRIGATENDGDVVSSVSVDNITNVEKMEAGNVSLFCLRESNNASGPEEPSPSLVAVVPVANVEGHEKSCVSAPSISQSVPSLRPEPSDSAVSAPVQPSSNAHSPAVAAVANNFELCSGDETDSDLEQDEIGDPGATRSMSSPLSLHDAEVSLEISKQSEDSSVVPESEQSDSDSRIGRAYPLRALLLNNLDGNECDEDSNLFPKDGNCEADSIDIGNVSGNDGDDSNDCHSSILDESDPGSQIPNSEDGNGNNVKQDECSAFALDGSNAHDATSADDELHRNSSAGNILNSPNDWKDSTAALTRSVSEPEETPNAIAGQDYVLSQSPPPTPIHCAVQKQSAVSSNLHGHASADRQRSGSIGSGKVASNLHPPTKRRRLKKSNGSVLSDISVTLHSTEDNFDQAHDGTLSVGPSETAQPGDEYSCPRILFTRVQPTAAQRKRIESLGGVIVDDVYQCTHLVTNKLYRTVKFLCAMNLGCHIVTVRWIDASARSKEWVDEGSHLIRDRSGEKRFNITMQQALESRSKLQTSGRRIFSGLRFFITDNVAPPPSEMQHIIESGGGEIVDSVDGGCYIITCEDDIATCQTLLNEYQTLTKRQFVSSEFVLQSSLQQKLVEPRDSVAISLEDESDKESSGRAIRRARRARTRNK